MEVVVVPSKNDGSELVRRCDRRPPESQADCCSRFIIQAARRLGSTTTLSVVMKLAKCHSRRRRDSPSMNTSGFHRITPSRTEPSSNVRLPNAWISHPTPYMDQTAGRAIFQPPAPLTRKPSWLRAESTCRSLVLGPTDTSDSTNRSRPWPRSPESRHSPNRPARTTRDSSTMTCAGSPTHVLTQGVGTILRAGHLVLLAWGENKAEAVRDTVEGPVTSMIPSTALQLHPHATVGSTAAASALGTAITGGSPTNQDRTR